MDIQHLSKKISPSFSLSAITFTLKTGEITGLIGRNGNGKSSLFKTMVGLYQKDTGAVLIDGQEIEHFTEQKEHVFLLQDSIAYFDSLKLKEISAYYQLAYPRFNHDLFQRELKKIKLTLDERYGKLSKGTKTMVRLISAFATGATYLFLDEPLDGLDTIQRKRALGFILKQATSTQVSILIASHQLQELESIADRILVLKQGSLVKDFYLERLHSTAIKVQFVFVTKEIPSIIRENATLLSVEGRVLTYLFEELPQELEENIKETKPVLFERLPVSIEDIIRSQSTKDPDYQMMNQEEC